VPIRLEVGPREAFAGTVTVARRDRSPRDRVTMPRGELVARVPRILEEIQAGLYQRAVAHRDEHTRVIDTRAELDAFFTPASRDPRRPEIHGGFALSHWCGQAACEKAIRRALGATIRCTPRGGLSGAPWEPRVLERGRCVLCGRPSAARVIVAKAY
jgi:prolyl-tRNA synthetase